MRTRARKDAAGVGGGFRQGKVEVVDGVLDPNFVSHVPNSETGKLVEEWAEYHLLGAMHQMGAVSEPV